MKKTKKIVIALIVLIALIGVGVLVAIFGGNKKIPVGEKPFKNLFVEGFQGITTQEKELENIDYVSSKHIKVKAGETIWYGPCDVTQNIQMATFDEEGNPAKIESRQKPLKPADIFSNHLVIYKYEVPEGVDKICFTVKKSLVDVYTISKTEITCLNWVAYWNLRDINTKQYVGENEFYEVAVGDKLYFGAIDKNGASSISVYDKKATKFDKIKDSDLKMVESFGDKYGIYCYTVMDKNIKYIETPTEGIAEKYNGAVYVPSDETITEQAAIDTIVASYGVQKPMDATVEALKGKSVLFLGDSIMAGENDKDSIYQCDGWAGRIGYYCDMKVTNGGVSKACVTAVRVDADGKECYIYNGLKKVKDKKFDYVILQGMYNDVVEKVEIGEPQGKENFDASKADKKKFADALELLFYQAKELYPDAKIGYIVNYQTSKMIDQKSYVDVAISICEDWGIPYLDLYHDSSFAAKLSDGLKLNSEDYDATYMRIATWLMSLGGSKTENDNVTTKARIMSYNVFWSPADEVPGKGITVKNRAEKVQNTILTCNPDILVLQEVSTGANSWVQILREFVKESGYEFYGFGHYKDRGIDTIAGVDTSTIVGNDVEMTPVLWKADKYECVEKGHYWASSKPEEAGTVWSGVTTSHSSGKLYPRCVNWIVLKDKETNEHIMVVSYHADPYSEQSRKLSAQLLMDKAREVSVRYDDLAIVIAGDMNMERHQPTYGVWTEGGYKDSQKVAEKTTTQNTFSAWIREKDGFAEADYVFVNHKVYVSEFQVYEDMDPEQNGVHVSDHCPIIADIEY